MSKIKDISDKLMRKFGKKDSSSEEKQLEETANKKSVDEIINSFLEDIRKWEGAYSSEGLFATITKYAKKAGITTVYYALLLYYSILSDRITGTEKALALAALGYFISPLDIIPDFLPGGLFDDTVILLYGIDKLGEAIDHEIERRAKDQLDRWFNDAEIIEISKEDMKKVLDIKTMITSPVKFISGKLLVSMRKQDK